MRTRNRYATSISSFSRFLDGGDVAFSGLDSVLMQGYEDFLKSNGLSRNTTSFYMRNLRAIYNRAVEQGLAEPRNLFRNVYTGIDKTVKRALTLKDIRKIKDMDLSGEPRMAFARDVFMFSFYTRGMSFIDIAFLRKKDLQNGILSYRRRKTGQLLFVKWEKHMQEIAGRYGADGSPYLLPLIADSGKDERRQYENSAHSVNRNLKKIGEALGLHIPLTMYVARHSWASIAKSERLPLSVISEALGHDSEATTRIYLALLDTSAVDKANNTILKKL